MNLTSLLDAVRRTTSYRRVVDSLRDPGGGASALTQAWELLGAARPAVLASLHMDWPGPILVLAAQPERARHLHEQSRLWSAHPEALWYFPAPDSLFYDRTSWDSETIRRRATVLSALATHDSSGKPPMLFASVWALMTRTVPAHLLRLGVRSIKIGQSIRLSHLLSELVACAYESVSVVEEPGTFAWRGGILDVFAPNATRPARIEWFGDRIESIRVFDPATQRSSQRIDSVVLFPASEALPRYSQTALPCLEDLDRLESALIAPRLLPDQERLARAEYFHGIEFYLPCLYPQPATLLQYLPHDVLLVADDLDAVDAAAETLESQAGSLRVELLEERQLPASFPPPYEPWRDLRASLGALTGVGLGYRTQDETDTTRHVEGTGFHSPPSFGGRLRQLVQDVLRSKADGQRVIIVSRQVQRLSDLFRDSGQLATPVDRLSGMPPAGSLTLVQGSVGEGWTMTAPPGGRPLLSAADSPLITLLSDTEVFGWAKPKRRPFTRKKAASPESFFAELREGDHVVHIEHGIGVYRGLVRKRTGDTQREYLELEYAAGDRLYVPVSQVDRVARYVGSSDRTPAVHRLGSADWARVRSQASKAVQDMAKELLQLYAARQVITGHAFSPDTPWQAELEASFAYEDTNDQLRALTEVKSDMESPRPMDRLICGDVGYGKTEVALRAAFKAVMDDRQVAVLVPTTVLAQQHLLTFRERLAAFPVEVAMLSRFCSPREQRDTLQRLQDGKVDIVVGTHRLIQKDVALKDLGLLIVDEEQRFGVRHKEWLKQMRQQIDVLTMTATPIPRTLYMSLSGARDMSIIDTPPEERLPIITQVSEYSERMIRRSILRELNRGGQVYFVHNRVRGIRQIAQRLQKIVPEASIAIGHGQMREDELSKVMLDFAAGEHDVLVCTSIIESGLDIPNVNTIVINRADRFGLAQLYQLRGRVGRSGVQAFAYLLYPKGQRLSDIARRRLQAIREASELGAGFRIAMRDLEIRGAGDILGARQHGHIAAIGFELYCRLLARAVRELKEAGPGAEVSAPSVEPPPAIQLPLQAYLPENYVPDRSLRLRLYQRMASLDTEEALDRLRQELEDRFGILPTQTKDLLYVLRVRVLATGAGVQAIGKEGDNLILKLSENTLDAARMIVSTFGQRAWLGRGQLWLALTEKESDWRTMLVAILLRLGHPTDSSSGGEEHR